MKVKVRCSYVVEVELPDDAREGEHFRFVIEENGCPGTGITGAEFYKHYQQHEEASTCWACALQGENKIIEIDGKPVE